MFCKEEKEMTPESNIRPATASDESAILAPVNQLHESVSVAEAEFRNDFSAVLHDPNQIITTEGLSLCIERTLCL